MAVSALITCHTDAKCNADAEKQGLQRITDQLMLFAWLLQTLAPEAVLTLQGTLWTVNVAKELWELPAKTQWEDFPGPPSGFCAGPEGW